jgi:hypothetical protein
VIDVWIGVATAFGMLVLVSATIGQLKGRPENYVGLLVFADLVVLPGCLAGGPGLAGFVVLECLLVAATVVSGIALVIRRRRA